jgi:type II secretory pathway pseudopilin PulG
MSSCAQGRPGHKAEHGFTYLGLLIFVVILGILLAMTGEVWSTVQKRANEEELLFVGHQFRQAIQLYYDRSPGGAKKYPQSLDDLLLDNRYLATQRFLRKIYVDPMTGKAEWGLVKAPDNGIAGVYSLSKDTPLKEAGFDQQDQSFENAKTYSDWQFTYQVVASGVSGTVNVSGTVVTPAAASAAQ